MRSSRCCTIAHSVLDVESCQPGSKGVQPHAESCKSIARACCGSVKAQPLGQQQHVPLGGAPTQWP